MRRLWTSVILLLSVCIISVLTAPSSARWSKWGEWSACACSSETRQRSRQCTRTDSSYCSGSNSESSQCEPKGCPDGKIIEKDIVVPQKDTFRSDPGDTDTWFTRRIPYSLDYSTRDSNHPVWNNVKNAMRKIENEIPDCLQFSEKRRDDHDYINITSFKNNECYSSVGKRGGEQLMNIDETCMSVGIIMHELLHALGFWHEQSRSDRDVYVTVIYENIIDNQKSQFDMREDNKKMERSIRYDYESIMHYKYDEFSKIEGQDTIVPKAKSEFNKLKLGQRDHLSELDKIRTQWLYKCGIYKISSCNKPTVIGVTVKPTPRATYAIGSAVTYSCPSGKFLFGPNFAKCKDNGQWTGSIPACFSSGHYAYLEASRKVQGYKATLQSPKIEVKPKQDMCLLFFYNMYGKGMGSLTVKLCYHGFQCTFVMDTLSGSTPDNNWKICTMKIITRQVKVYAIKFEATRGPSVESDIAIDDILIAPCTKVNQYNKTYMQRVKEEESNGIDTGTKPGEFDTIDSGNDDMKV